MQSLSTWITLENLLKSAAEISLTFKVFEILLFERRLVKSQKSAVFVKNYFISDCGAPLRGFKCFLFISDFV